MNYKIRLFLKCVSVMTALTAGSVTCFSTPATAHVMNHEVLSIQLNQVETNSMLTSNLLAEGGQTIIVNGDFSEMQIPIHVFYEGASLTRDVIPTAAVLAKSSDESVMTASLDTEEILLENKEYTINLTLKMEGVTETDSEETPENPESTEDTTGTEEPVIKEDTLGMEEPVNKEDITETEDTAVTDEITDTNSGYQLPSIEELNKEKENEDLGIWELPVFKVGTGVEETAEGEPSEGGTPEGEIPEAETPEIESPEGTEPEIGGEVLEGEIPEGETPETEIPEGETPEGESPEGTEGELPEGTGGKTPEDEPSEGETPEDEVPEETEPEGEKPLSAEVILTIGEKIYSATILINEESEEETAIGELQFCPSQYHPTGVLEFVNNQEIETVIGEFPAMTKYTVSEEEYLLYSGGNIKLSPGARLRVDVSYTELKEDFTFYSGAGTSYTIAYTDVPHDFKELYPLIIDGNGKILPVNYQWGTMTPIVRVEQLTVGKDGLEWKAVETITCKENDDGKLQIVPNKPEAGTYRIEILWVENEITLYRLEIPFYVQYGSVDQGGTE